MPPSVGRATMRGHRAPTQSGGGLACGAAAWRHRGLAREEDGGWPCLKTFSRTGCGSAKGRSPSAGGTGVSPVFAFTTPFLAGALPQKSFSRTGWGVQRGFAPLPGARGCPPYLASSPPSWPEPALSLSKGRGRGDGRNGRGAPTLQDRGGGFEAKPPFPRERAVPLRGSATRRSAPPAGGALLTHSFGLGLRRYVVLDLRRHSLDARRHALIRQVLDMTTLHALVVGPIHVLRDVQVTTAARASSQQHHLLHLSPIDPSTYLTGNYVLEPLSALCTRSPIR